MRQELFVKKEAFMNEEAFMKQEAFVNSNTSMLDQFSSDFLNRDESRNDVSDISFLSQNSDIFENSTTHSRRRNNKT